MKARKIISVILAAAMVCTTPIWAADIAGASVTGGSNYADDAQYVDEHEHHDEHDPLFDEMPDDNIGYPEAEQPDSAPEVTEALAYEGAVATSFASGRGTDADPYIIMNGEQLAYLAQLVNTYAADADGVYYRAKSYKLGADITVDSSVQWDPIGNYASSNYRFYGIFNGDGHTVSGLYIDSTGKWKGLFGYVYGSSAIVKNVGVINSSIKGDNYVGGVVGYNSSGTVSGCCNTGAVTGSGSYVGGVVGWNYYGTVSGCYNTGAVTGSDYIGGVVGRNEYGTVNSCYNTGAVTGSGNYIGGVEGYNSYGTVSGCYNTGAVTGDDYIGGVAGNNQWGMVSDCYNTGAVTGSSSSEYIGAIVGTGNAPYNSYYLDTLEAAGSGIPLTAAELESPYTAYLLNSNGFDTATAAYNIWGHDSTKPVFASEAHPAITSKPTVTYDITLPDIDWYTDKVYEISTYEELLGLSRLVNSGTETFEGKTVKLTADITLGGEDEYWEPIGNGVSISYRSFHGIFNGQTHTVSGMYIDTGCDYQGLFGHISYTSTNIKNVGVINSSIKGGDYVGMVGYNSDGTVSGCYNTGAVTGIDYIGGVVGFSSGAVSGCYNTGAINGSSYNCYVGGVVGYSYYSMVSGCYNTSTVAGSGYYIGGVVGYNYGSSSKYAIVEYCYSAGDVIRYSTHFDCAIGYNNSNTTITSVYFLDTAYENIVTSGGAPLTDAQMRDTVNYAANYAGFDFTNTWTMGGNPDYPYAELAALPHLMPPTSTITGDADGDGAVTWADSYLIAHYLAGWDGTDGIDLTASDADGDGTVTWADATVVARHLAGWTGYEALPYAP